ncbi:hypothetical protein [Borrelia persica]|uniref:hypothetical protein n=1 Tax=Borrelia persica TaxID=44448 RepID=UPI000466CB18|nr:hypothetical protein [Borrelia persica]
MLRVYVVLYVICILLFSCRQGSPEAVYTNQSGKYGLETDGNGVGSSVLIKRLYDRYYGNDIDLETGILTGLKARQSQTKEEALKHFHELVDSFKFYGKNFVAINPFTLDVEGIFGFPALIPSSIFTKSSVPSQVGQYDADDVYATFRYDPNYLYALIYSIKRMNDVYLKTPVEKKHYSDAMANLINKLASMTSGLYPRLTFSKRAYYQSIDYENFKNLVKVQDLIAFNEQLEIYLRKLSRVADRVLGNILQVLLNCDPEKLEAEDLYEIFDKMNNDQKIQTAINVMVGSKDAVCDSFEKLYMDSFFAAQMGQGDN